MTTIVSDCENDDVVVDDIEQPIRKAAHHSDLHARTLVVRQRTMNEFVGKPSGDCIDGCNELFTQTIPLLAVPEEASTTSSSASG